MIVLEFLTVAEAAEILKVHPRTIKRAIDSGALRASEIAAGKWRIRPADLEAWIEQRSNATRPARPAAVVTPLAAATTARSASRRRRPAAGALTITPEMGRTA